MNHTRRRFLQSAAATSALAAASVSSSGRAFAQSSLDNFPGSSKPEPVTIPLGELPFVHGVASGDPLPNTVVLWTRVTPSAEAMPGSGIGEDVTLTWDVALDAEFTSAVVSGRVVATSASDHTVHVDPFGLSANTTYFYRFTVADGPLAGRVSPVGRTVTAPPLNSSPDSLRFAVASCANWEGGFYTAYGDMARRGLGGELDFVLFLGDYLYEYASGVNPGKSGVTRPFEPPWEIVTAQDYRVRHGQYRRDTELQAAHAAAPWVVTWDDHEIANDASVPGAQGHDLFEGDWAARRAAAMGAYLDWMPVRASNPAEGGRLYRSLRFGTLAELHMLDLRSYRSGPGLIRSTDPERTIMGQEQFTWLSQKLSTSDATWSLIGTSVMISPLELLDLDPAVRAPLAAITGADSGAELATGLNADQWDGYPADRDRLLTQIAETRPDASTVFLTGDIHSEWAGKVSHRGRVIGAELVCSSVTAPNLDDALHLPAGSAISRAAERHVLANNPHFEHVNLDAHGYMIVRLDAEGVKGTWLRVDDIERAGSPVRVRSSWVFSGGS